MEHKNSGWRARSALAAISAEMAELISASAPTQAQRGRVLATAQSFVRDESFLLSSGPFGPAAP